MNNFGMARCIRWQEREIGVQFGKIGNYSRFLKLLDEFKLSFPDRNWHTDGWWIIPETRYKDIQTFCERHGIRIIWAEGRQPSLWA